MVEFGIGNIKEAQDYANSFGETPDNIIYNDVFNTRVKGGQLKSSPELKKQFQNINNAIAANIISRNQVLKSKYNSKLKAFTTGIGGVGTTDNVAVPFSLDYDMVDTSRVQTPLRAMFRRVTNQGIKAVYNLITAKQTPSFQAELQAQSISDMTLIRKEKVIKIIRVSGYTSGLAQTSVPSFNLTGTGGTSDHFGDFGNIGVGNAIDLNVQTAMEAMFQFEENALFNGNSVLNPLAFDGVVSLQGTTNQLNKLASSISLDDLTTGYMNAYRAGGQPTVAFCDTVTYQKILSLMSAKSGFLEYKDLGAYGFNELMIRAGNARIPLIPSRNLSILSGAQSLYFLDMTMWEVRVLLDLTFQRLAQVDDGDKFMLKMYETLVDKSEGTFNSCILNMTN